MNKEYKVITEVDLTIGALGNFAPGANVQLSDEDAAPFLEAGQIELVEVEAPAKETVAETAQTEGQSATAEVASGDTTETETGTV
jgi:hypothetical protein